MKGIILSCEIENIATRRDGSIKVILGTPELSAGNAAELLGLRNKIAAVYISPKDSISQGEIEQADSLDPGIPGKSPSQRMRNVLFLLFKQGNEGHKEFDSYYRAKMELFIESLKGKIL